MSDPMTNVEIEDVLSSIRRLVSEDLRVPGKIAPRQDSGMPPVDSEPAQAGTPAAKLVLTPAFRVAEPSGPDAGTPDAAGDDWQRDAETDAGIVQNAADVTAEPGSLEDTIAELEAAVAGIDDAFETEEAESADDVLPEMPAFPDDGEAAAGPDGSLADPEEMAVEAGTEAVGAAGDPAGEKPWKSLRSSTASVWSQPAWPTAEPTGESDADAVPTGDGADSLADDDLMETPVAGDAMRFGRAGPADDAAADSAVDESAAPPAADAADEDSGGQDGPVGEAAAGAILFGAAAFRSPRIIRAADHSAEIPAAEVVTVAPTPDADRSDAAVPVSEERAGSSLGAASGPAGPAAAGGAEADDLRDADGAFGLEDASDADPVDAEGDAGLFDATDDLVIDADALRDLVAEIIRQELQGPLGERITRNVRKLVRREIARALEGRALEGQRGD